VRHLQGAKLGKAKGPVWPTKPTSARILRRRILENEPNPNGKSATCRMLGLANVAQMPRSSGMGPLNLATTRPDEEFAIAVAAYDRRGDDIDDPSSRAMPRMPQHPCKPRPSTNGSRTIPFFMSPRFMSPRPTLELRLDQRQQAGRKLRLRNRRRPARALAR